MRNKSGSLFILMIAFLFSPLIIHAQAEATSKLITAAISSGNQDELVTYFNTMVDLVLPGTGDLYSKTQASRILKDFFIKYPVKSYNMTKTGLSNDGSFFSIGELKAGNKTFRVYYLLKNT